MGWKMRLIDADVLIEYMDLTLDIIKPVEAAVGEEPIRSMIIEGAIEQVKAMPTIDAEPVKHGRWIKNEAESALHVEPIYDCSACHNWQAWGNYECTPYCPNCGAIMDSNAKESYNE